MIIYKTTNLANGKFYIGKSIHDDPSYLGSGTLLKRDIEKHGEHTFKKEILQYCLTVKELNEREIFWISETKAKELGYNIADGGHGGNTYNEEISKRISEKFKGRVFSEETVKKRAATRAINPEKYKHSAETKAKIGSYHKGKKLSPEHIAIITKLGKEKIFSEQFLAQQKKDKRGVNHPCYGKSPSEETRRKLSEAHKRNPRKPNLGKKMSEETKKKIREASKGRRWTEEQRLKHSGSNASFFGKKHDANTKEKISKACLARTPEQKLEKYIRFYVSKKGVYPTAEQEAGKLKDYLTESF